METELHPVRLLSVSLSTPLIIVLQWRIQMEPVISLSDLLYAIWNVSHRVNHLPPSEKPKTFSCSLPMSASQWRSRDRLLLLAAWAQATLWGSLMSKQVIRGRIEMVRDGCWHPSLFAFITMQLFGFDPLTLHCLGFFTQGWIKTSRSCFPEKIKHLILSHLCCCVWKHTLHLCVCVWERGACLCVASSSDDPPWVSLARPPSVSCLWSMSLSLAHCEISWLSCYWLLSSRTCGKFECTEPDCRLCYALIIAFPLYSLIYSLTCIN